jgi:hypothetical protein
MIHWGWLLGFAVVVAWVAVHLWWIARRTDEPDDDPLN